MRYVELRRHTDNEGDRLTPRGVADAEMISRELLHPPYAAFVSTGAARATQMLEILRHAVGQDDTPITPATGLRSSAEDRWRAAGKGADLDAMRAVDPDLAERESLLLALALRQVVEGLPRGRPGAGGGPQSHQRGSRTRAHRPGRPAAGQGGRVLLIEDGRDYQVEPLDLNGGE
jgi:hypothetical protein